MSTYSLRKRNPSNSSPRTGSASPVVRQEAAVAASPKNSPRPRVESTASEADVTPQKSAQPAIVEPEGDKWAKWWRRMWSGLAMVFGFFGYLHLGRTVGLILLILGVQSRVYKEIVVIQLNISKEKKLPAFSLFYVYWFVVAVIFMYGGALKDIILEHEKELGPTLSYAVANYHLFSYVLWIIGFVAFVLSLGSRSLYGYQFSQFGYCHMALLVVVGQSTMLAANVFSGFIWFVIPCGMVVCNDTFAYFAGFFFGKTPLIKLSPKKTWEGFIGGFIATIIWSFWFTRLLQTPAVSDFYTCPRKSFSWDTPQCEVTDLYALRPLSTYFPSGVPSFLPSSLDILVSKMMWHAVVMAVFASFVAPFGGFFASGFKRAFKIKDFGDALPGHGGFTDRMDCQIVMGAFAYMYYHFVVSPAGLVDSVMATVCRMSPEEVALLKERLQDLSHCSNYLLH